MAGGKRVNLAGRIACATVNRGATAHARVGRAEDAFAGGKDCKTVGAALAASVAPRAFPNPSGRSLEVSFAPDKRGGKVPLPVRRFRRCVPDTIHTAPGRSALRPAHCVAPRRERCQTACQQKAILVKWPDPWELTDKLAGLAARCRKVEPSAPDSHSPSRQTMARSV